MVVLGIVRTGVLLFRRIRSERAEVREVYNYYGELGTGHVALGLLLEWT